MNNSPFEPEQHSRYGGAYQPSDPYAPTAPSSNPYPSTPYQQANPYAPPPPPIYSQTSPYTPPPGKQQGNRIFLIVGLIAVLVLVSIGGLFVVLQRSGGTASATPTPAAAPTSTPTPLPYPAV